MPLRLCAASRASATLTVVVVVVADSAAAKAEAAAEEKGWVEGLEEGSGTHSWFPSTISFLVMIFSDGERGGQFCRRGARLERLAGARRDAWLKVERVRRMEKRVRVGCIFDRLRGETIVGM